MKIIHLAPTLLLNFSSLVTAEYCEDLPQICDKNVKNINLVRRK